jgi:hypothetical protein
METHRKDVKRNRRQTICPNSSWLGYSSSKLKYGDLFMYYEYYEDKTTGTRIGKCHGRIKPIAENKSYILSQSISTNLQFSYERWVDPKDVIEIIPKEKANKNILAFFENNKI